MDTEVTYEVPSISQTERYTHVTGDQLRDAVALLTRPATGLVLEKVGQPAVNANATVA